MPQNPSTLRLRNGRPYLVDVESVTATSISTEDLRSTGGAVSLLNTSTVINRLHPPNTNDLEVIDEVNGGAVGDQGIRLRLYAGAGGQANGLTYVQGEGFGSWASPSWEKRRELRMSFFSGLYSEETFVGTGACDLRSQTQEHIGVIIDNGELLASVADGTTQDTVTLDTGLSGDSQWDLIIDYAGYNGGDGPAVLTINRQPQGQFSDVPIKTYTHTFGSGDALPSGTSADFDRTEYSGSARTPNGDASHEVHLNHIDYVGYPSFYEQ